ncbi:hypothetical protein B0H10DRAFT_1789448 [Mycena sp. CBHHK59/15]|nr:hypothetical protein B0H10DRAFT_1789448 [Mycena sp. CBHHK59/15]
MYRSITIDYTLRPPAPAAQVSELPTSKKHEFQVAATANAGQQEYYGILRDAIARAKEEVGQELTAWRDAVGKAELNKESKKVAKEDDGGDEEDEEDV